MLRIKDALLPHVERQNNIMHMESPDAQTEELMMQLFHRLREIDSKLNDIVAS
jgi:hypothetical protein